MTTPDVIPGADELMGRGVYCGMPRDVPSPVRDRRAVVVGDLVDCEAVTWKLVEAGWSVTFVTRERRCGGSLRRECRLRASTELVCVTGIDYLEALVLRRMDSGRIEACNASALFIL